jgi:hypothetical protein
VVVCATRRSAESMVPSVVPIERSNASEKDGDDELPLLLPVVLPWPRTGRNGLWKMSIDGSEMDMANVVQILFKRTSGKVGKRRSPIFL